MHSALEVYTVEAERREIDAIAQHDYEAARSAPHDCAVSASGSMLRLRWIDNQLNTSISRQAGVLLSSAIEMGTTRLREHYNRCPNNERFCHTLGSERHKGQSAEECMVDRSEQAETEERRYVGRCFHNSNHHT